MSLPGSTDTRLRALALLAAASITVELSLARHPGARGPAIAVGLALTGCLALARRSPLGALTAFVGVALLQTLAGLHVLNATSTSVFVAMGLAFCIALWASEPETAAAVVITVAGLTASLAIEGDNGQIVGDAAFILLVIMGMPLVAGRILRARMALNARLDEQARELEHNRAEREQAAVLAERTRIARELHDVVAHDVSVMLVQAQAARRIVPTDPERAREAIAAVEATGREALGELRRLLGVLRRGDEDLALAPQPSLARVPALLERIRAAGLPVDLQVAGEPLALPPGLDAAAFRVVQEALANVMEHARAGSAQVRVAYGAADVELRVRDDGAGAPNEPIAEGRGLVGLQERVGLYGGELRARRRRAGGFELRARLPVGERAT